MFKYQKNLSNYTLVYIFPSTNFLKSFLVVQNFSKALKIGVISFNLSSLDKVR